MINDHSSSPSQVKTEMGYSSWCSPFSPFPIWAIGFFPDIPGRRVICHWGRQVSCIMNLSVKRCVLCCCCSHHLLPSLSILGLGLLMGPFPKMSKFKDIISNLIHTMHCLSFSDANNTQYYFCVSSLCKKTKLSIAELWPIKPNTATSNLTPLFSTAIQMIKPEASLSSW